jgi:hypothetical protein
MDLMAKESTYPKKDINRIVKKQLKKVPREGLEKVIHKYNTFTSTSKTG